MGRLLTRRSRGSPAAARPRVRHAQQAGRGGAQLVNTTHNDLSVKVIKLARPNASSGSHHLTPGPFDASDYLLTTFGACKSFVVDVLRGVPFKKSTSDDLQGSAGPLTSWRRHLIRHRTSAPIDDVDEPVTLFHGVDYI